MLLIRHRKREGGEEQPVIWKNRVSTDKTPERSTQPSWDLVLGTENHPGKVFFPWRLWGKCLLYFLSGASGFRLSTCPKTLSLIKAGASSEILGRIYFRSQYNSHLTHGSWSHLNVGRRKPFVPKQHLKWTQPASHWPLYLFHQLAQTCTFDILIRTNSGICLLCLLSCSHLLVMPSQL